MGHSVSTQDVDEDDLVVEEKGLFWLGIGWTTFQLIAAYVPQASSQA